MMESDEELKDILNAHFVGGTTQFKAAIQSMLIDRGLGDEQALSVAIRSAEWGVDSVPSTIGDVAAEALSQSESEIRRLRRGMTEALQSRGDVRSCIRELLEGLEATPSRPEWDHHREDNDMYPFQGGTQ